MKIVVFGSTSFAATGLIERLAKAGHEVWGVNRRADSRLGARSVTADPWNLASATEAISACDVVVNFLIVNGTGAEGNLRYCEQLRSFIVATNPRRVIHVSSISVLPPVSGVVTEADMPGPDYSQKGDYAKVKIATELWIVKNITDRELVIVRPGFIIAPGVEDPIVGMGKHLPTKQVLGLGSERSTIPLITRDRMDEAMVRLIDAPLANKQSYFMFVNPRSPTRREYLDFCLRQFALGTRTLHMPVFLWYTMLGVLSPAVSVLKRRKENLVAKFRHNLRVRTYDCSVTEKALGLSLSEEWRLPANTLEGQDRNYDFERFRQPAPAGGDPAADVLYVGMGRIVQDRHLPGLQSLKFAGEIQWFDPYATPTNRFGSLRFKRVEQLASASARRVVVATPASIRPALVKDLAGRGGRILFEKPLSLDAAQRDLILEALKESEVFVLHNYRYKSNSLEMLQKLAYLNSGKLLHTAVHFDSPPVQHERAAWMRDERRARTLLVDYSLHYLDMAWLFADGRGRITDLDFHRNAKGATEWISGSCQFENMRSRFFLRQGARQRRAHIDYVFQNYTIRLRFFPDICTLVLGRYTSLDDFAAGIEEVGAMGRKVAEKLKWTPPEASHERVLAGFLGFPNAHSVEELRAPKLKNFYDLLFEIADQVYA